MKKYGLLTISIIFIITLFAQNTLNIFKSDLSVLNIIITSIDSLKFNNNETALEIYNKDNTQLNVLVSEIDSLTFTENTSQSLPAVTTAEATTVSYTTAQSGLTIQSTGGTSITEKGICWNTTEHPDLNGNKIIASSASNVSTVSLTGLPAGTTVYIRAFATNNYGTTYGNQISINTLSYSLPEVETVSATYNYSTNKATCVGNVKSNGGCGSIIERGICWSTKANPTITDSKYASGATLGQFYAIMSELSLNSTYYVRAYATNCAGTAYGLPKTVKPLMGNVTYNLDIDSVANPQPYKLIKIAMDSACYYYNRYTTFSANIYVYYNAGIPTAQASYRGSIGFGPNTRYMWVGTAMHEMAHYMGSGTTNSWKNFTTTGTYTGVAASTLLKSLTGETLKGDTQHFWPYGINQKEEVTSANDYVIHCKIVNAMKTDCGW
jgi:hypothetical protein